MPRTLKLRADSPADIERAARLLREGGTVAFPTETVYGLGADALNRTAVARIFEAKQRPSWDPLIVHIAERENLSAIVQLEGETQKRVNLLAQAFWPGPLTLLLPKQGTVPSVVTAGRHLVGVRVPAHPAARALLRAAGVPVAAPSANTFGHTSPTTAKHVLDDLEGRIDAVLDGGPTSVGLESTVLDPTQTPMVLYRPGAVTPEQINAVTGGETSIFIAPTQTVTAAPEALPSPGVGMRHYAPRARVVLVEGDEADLRRAMSGVENAGVLLPTDWFLKGSVVVERWGSWRNPEELAAKLFAGLRALDDREVEVIFCPLPPPGGLNEAIRDRLLKAARDK